MKNPFVVAYKFWTDIPLPVREPIRSAVVSMALGLVTAISTLGSAYFTDHPYDWHGFFAYLLTPHAVGAIAVAIAAVHRARQAQAKVASTVVTPEGAVVQVLSPPTDGTRYPNVNPRKRSENMIIAQSDLDQMTPRPPEDVTTIVIHHTVMSQTAAIEDVAAAEAPNGWLAVGYNSYCGLLNGTWTMQEGRPLDKKPAAQFGLNGPGYAIAIGGNYQPGGASWLDTVSQESLQVVAAHVQAVKAKCPNLKYLIGHRDVAAIAVRLEGGSFGDYSTECPGDALWTRLNDLRLLAGLQDYPSP